MRTVGALFALSTLLLSACGAPPPALAPAPAPEPVASSSASAPLPAEAPPAPPAAERVSVDTPRATQAGATFTVPAGWSIATRGSTVVLEMPEPDGHIAMIDVEADSADRAVEGAWKAYKPESKRPLKLASDRPARKGWEARRVYDYETSPNERLFVQAIAYKHKGSSWTVLIIDSSEPTFERRLAGLRLVFDTLSPKGYQRESFAGKKAHPLDDARKKALADFVALAQKELGIPGVAVGIVQGGKVVMEQGFGSRELGKPAPIDKDTRFLVASNTKAMTTLLLAKEVDQGKFQWETPVTQIYPAFKLGDAETTKSVLVKHLVCACTGLPRQDLEWIFEYKSATPQSTMSFLGTLQPTTRFGETYQYSNLLAAAAGYVGAYALAPKKDLGKAYDEAMAAMVFEPLGMRSTFDFKAALRGNHASPHGDDVDGKPGLARMDLNYSVVPVRPAGGLWASTDDMLKLVSFELSNGKLPSGKAWVSEKNLLARREAQVKVGDDTTYGMGLSVDRGYGVPIVHHGGSLFGYKSDMMWLPEHEVGAVVLTNADSGGRLLRPFLRRLVEVLFDGEAEAEADLLASARSRREGFAKERARLSLPADPAVVSKLAARYSSQVLGQVTVRAEDGKTVLDLGEWRSAVATRKNDDGTVSLVTVDPGSLGFEFVLGEREGKRVLVVRDAQHEYVFTEA